MGGSRPLVKIPLPAPPSTRHEKQMKELTLHDYQQMIHAILSRLPNTGHKGLPGVQIVMDTRHPDVVLPDFVLAKYPETITLMFQHQYGDLVLKNDRFTVLLSFNGYYASVCIPLAAIIHFTDFESGLIMICQSPDIEKPDLHLVEEPEKTDPETSNVVSLSSWRKR